MLEWIEDIFPDLVTVIIIVLLPLAGFVVSFLVFRRDRAKLNIQKFEFQLKTQKGSAFSVFIVNSGRRPIVIDSVYLCSKSGSKYLPTSDSIQNYELTEGKQVNIVFGVYQTYDVQMRREGFSLKSINPLEVTGVEVTDTRGKKYERKLTRRQRREIASQWQQRGRDS